VNLAIEKSASRLGALETRLASFTALSSVELRRLRCEPSDYQLHPARAVILEGGGTEARLVMSGWLGCTRVLSDGRRQIMHLALPGDVVTAPPFADSAVVALTAARTVDAAPILLTLRRARLEAPNVWRAWRAAQAEMQRHLLEQILRLGSLTAYERTANLIVELVARNTRVGLSDGRVMQWPLTQEAMSDVLGLSIVHLNRVLMQLRRDRLIQIRSGVLAVSDMERLAAVANASTLALPAGAVTEPRPLKGASSGPLVSGAATQHP
jgi:CRP-like cAMP-binding protein